MTVDVSVRSSLHGNADGLYHPPLPENPTSDTLDETNNFCASFVVGATTGDRSTTFLEDENQFEPRPYPTWSSAHLSTEQSKDKHINAVLQWLKVGKRPPKEEMGGADRHMGSIQLVTFAE